MTKACMIDFETLAVTPNATVASLGAVLFDPYAPKFYIQSQFYTQIALAGQVRTISQKTLWWWMQQSPEAQRCFDPGNTVLSLKDAMKDFGDWAYGSQFFYGIDIGDYTDHGLCDEIWSMGADFDIAIMVDAFDQCNMVDALPWKHGAQRCLRTLKNLYPGMEPKREGTYHNALDDAKHQALWTWLIQQKIKADKEFIAQQQEMVDLIGADKLAELMSK